MTGRGTRVPKASSSERRASTAVVHDGVRASHNEGTANGRSALVVPGPGSSREMRHEPRPATLSVGDREAARRWER